MVNPEGSGWKGVGGGMAVQCYLYLMASGLGWGRWNWSVKGCMMG